MTGTPRIRTSGPGTLARPGRGAQARCMTPTVLDREPTTGGVARTALARWPAAFGVAVAALSLADYADSGEAVVILTIAATGYVLVALLDRPALTWPLAVALSAVVVALRVLDVEPAPVLGVAALVLAA